MGADPMEAGAMAHLNSNSGASSATTLSDLLCPGLRLFADLAALSSHPVILYGETGSGKTHLARIIHGIGPRAPGPFLRVNCATIPESLFEREMFGHVRGAFTDARESRPGAFEAAHRGTLFLDEIGELPLAVQAKLLAVLDDGCIRRLGSTHEVWVDVRVVAATNRDLTAMVAAREFREDLYFRCSVLEYTVPPLRERRRDIPGLAAEMLRRNAPPGTAAELSPEARAFLLAYRWPGNLRELENAIRQALVYSHNGVITPEHLPARVRTAKCASKPTAGADPGHRYSAPADPAVEIRMIRDALTAELGNRTRAARRLGMSRASLWIKLQSYATTPELADFTGRSPTEA